MTGSVLLGCCEEMEQEGREGERRVEREKKREGSGAIVKSAIALIILGSEGDTTGTAQRSNTIE